MTRRPPSSTLFPYPTLSRSHTADDDRALRRIAEMADIREAVDIHLRRVFEELVHEHGPFGRCFDRETHVMLDRKSTRLNSSHLVISYAVFCLKKKKSYGLMF